MSEIKTVRRNRTVPNLVQDLATKNGSQNDFICAPRAGITAPWTSKMATFWFQIEAKRPKMAPFWLQISSKGRLDPDPTKKPPKPGNDPRKTVPFWTILGTQIRDFSCYFLVSFFDRFFKAFGGILAPILRDSGRSL